MNSIFGIGGIFGAALATMVIDHTPDFIIGHNPPKGKGKFQYRLDDKRAETPVKSKSLKRLLNQKGRK